MNNEELLKLAYEKLAFLEKEAILAIDASAKFVSGQEVCDAGKWDMTG